MPNWKKVIVSGSNAHLNELTSSTFLVDGNQSSNFIAVIDNDQNTAGHVLKLATDGTGNGSHILDMENGSNTMFRARADGRFAFGNSAVSSMGAGTFVVGIDGGHTSDIAISKRLQHLGDSNTYIDFETDKIILSAGDNLLDYTTTKLSGSAVTTASFGRVELSTIGGFTAEGAINFNSQNMTNVNIDSGTVDGITTLTTGTITSALDLKEGGGNTVITYPSADLGSDAECEIKIGDVDTATTGMFLSIKPVDEEISVGSADLLVNDIVHQGDTDTKISFTTDQIQFKAGNVNMLTLEESTADTATFVADTIDIGDAVISGSLTSSGSFGKMVVGGTFANSGSTLFKVQGQQGTLFSIVDEMSGSIFSANTQAGIPVIEAFSDQKVVLGPASNQFTIKADGNVTMSSTTTASFGRVQASSIGGNSPLIIESDNFNVDASGNLSIATSATASIGVVSATVDVPTTGFIRSRRFRGRSPISFDTEDTRIEVTGSIVATGAITASGDMSASGTMVASNLSGTNTGDSQTTFTLAGDGGSSQTISNGNTLTVEGGDGITTTAGNTDKVEVALDTHISNVQSLLNASLKIGASSTDEYIDFGTDAMIKFAIDDTEDFRMSDGGTFHARSDVVAFSSTPSDERLKDNVVTINNGLSIVNQLRGVTFDWNSGDRKGHKDYGVIAQEVEKVLPELVNQNELPLVTNTDEVYKTVDYEKLTAVLIEAVKDLSKEVEYIKQNCDCLKK